MTMKVNTPPGCPRATWRTLRVLEAAFPASRAQAQRIQVIVWRSAGGYDLADHDTLFAEKPDLLLAVARTSV